MDDCRPQWGTPFCAYLGYVSEFMNYVPHFFSPPFLSAFLPSLTPAINTMMDIKWHYNCRADMTQYNKGRLESTLNINVCSQSQWQERLKRWPAASLKKWWWNCGEFSRRLGEGNDTPLQYSCLENPMEGGAWWAVLYGVAQSRTRLKRLNSSSSSQMCGASETCIKDVNLELVRLYVNVKNMKWDESSETNFG